MATEIVNSCETYLNLTQLIVVWYLVKYLVRKRKRKSWRWVERGWNGLIMFCEMLKMFFAFRKSRFNYFKLCFFKCCYSAFSIEFSSLFFLQSPFCRLKINERKYWCKENLQWLEMDFRAILQSTKSKILRWKSLRSFTTNANGAFISIIQTVCLSSTTNCLKYFPLYWRASECVKNVVKDHRNKNKNKHQNIVV